MRGLGWNDDCFPRREHCGSGSRLRIAGAQMLGIVRRFAFEQPLGVARGDPSALFGDADRHDFVFCFIDRIHDRRSREQRNFVLATATAKQNSHF